MARKYRLSEHAEDMLKERNIDRQWLESALRTPAYKEVHEDGTVHYLKQIPKFGNRCLRVVLNPGTNPAKIVTVFFDRRLRRT